MNGINKEPGYPGFFYLFIRLFESIHRTVSDGKLFQSQIQTAIEMDLKLRNNKSPIVHGLVPFFQYFLTSAVNELEQGIFTGKSAFIFRIFTYLTVEAFNNIGGVNNTTKFFRVLKILR